MKLERAVPCVAPMRPGRVAVGAMVLPGLVVSVAVAIATVIMALHV